MRRLRVVLPLIALVGCAYIRPQVETLTLDMDFAGVDRRLQRAASQMVERRTEPDGVVEVRRYKGRGLYYDVWDLTFKNGRLVGVKHIYERSFSSEEAPRTETNMNILCRDAIAGGNRGGMLVHC